MKAFTNWLWTLLAWVLSRPFTADWLIRRSQRTPYIHLTDYMQRWWVFNPYHLARSSRHWRAKLPSVRVHHILRRDQDRHLHDHPWNARTIVLRGWYVERRMELDENGIPIFVAYRRCAGDTATLRFGEYHTIDEVSDGGVFTLFFTWKYQGTWGFMVNGTKVPHRVYLKDRSVA